MDVVSPDLNSILPDEIMDTEAMAMEEDPPGETSTPSSRLAPEPAQVPMETEVPEMVSLCSVTTPTQKTEALTTTDSTLCSISTGTQLVITSASSSGSKMATTVTTTLPSSPVVGQSVAKLSAPFTPTSPANHQLIINKVAADGKSPGTTVLKQEGQKLLVTGLSKAGQPIVLALPNTWSKPATSQGTGGDVKPQATQFKMMPAGAKPVIGVQAVSSANQLLGSSSPLQAQQLKTVQVCV